jgi:hypothetical protein
MSQALCSMNEAFTEKEKHQYVHRILEYCCSEQNE